MLATELEIKKKGKLYQLKYKNKRIRCFNSADYVEHENQELIEFIKDDLYRCGELKLNKKSVLNFETTPCAYLLFSSRKSLYKTNFYNGMEHKDFLSKYFIFDLIFYNVNDEANLELKNSRKKIREKIGDKYFEDLLKYSWGRFVGSDMKMYDYDVPLMPKNGVANFPEEELEEINETWDASDIDQYIKDGDFYISEADFANSSISKKLISIFDECTDFEKISVLTLFHSFNRFSFLLPLFFIRGWINKRDFLNSMMVIHNFQYWNRSELNRNFNHQESYKSLNELAVLCFNYASIGDREQKEIWNTIQIGETENIEFKESLSLDVRKSMTNNYSPKKDKDIELSVLKNIAGFLNSEGGTLFIGVKDDKEILGIDREVELLHKCSIDKIQLHLKNLINTNFGKGNPLIEFSIKEIFKKKIILIKCSNSEKLIYLKKLFYIRKGPGVECIQTPEEMIQYLEKINQNKQIN